MTAQATVSPTQWSTLSTTIACSPGTPGPTGSSYSIAISYPFSIGLPPIFGTAPFRYSGNLTTSATERLE